MNLQQIKEDSKERIKEIKEKIKLIELGNKMGKMLPNDMETDLDIVLKYINKLSDFRLKQAETELEFFEKFIKEIEQELISAKA